MDSSKLARRERYKAVSSFTNWVSDNTSGGKIRAVPLTSARSRAAVARDDISNDSDSPTLDANRVGSNCAKT